MTTLLSMEGVSAYYGNLQALFSVDLEVREGEVLGIVGANGAGKSTLLRAVSRMVRTTGRIEVFGRDVSRMSTEDVARLGVAHVPEGRGTFPGLTVAENLKLAATQAARNAAGTRAGDLELVYANFPVLQEFEDRPAGSLSGGQQQMLALARAILVRPALLMVDEPTLGLAPRLAKDILGRLRVLGQEWNTSILLVEQSATLAVEVTDRLYVLGAGRVTHTGASSDDALAAALATSYLGG